MTADMVVVRYRPGTDLARRFPEPSEPLPRAEAEAVVPEMSEDVEIVDYDGTPAVAS